MKVIPLRNILINGQHCEALTEVDLDLDEGTLRTLRAQGLVALCLTPAPIETTEPVPAPKKRAKAPPSRPLRSLRPPPPRASSPNAAPL